MIVDLGATAASDYEGGKLIGSILMFLGCTGRIGAELEKIKYLLVFELTGTGLNSRVVDDTA